MNKNDEFNKECDKLISGIDKVLLELDRKKHDDYYTNQSEAFALIVASGISLIVASGISLVMCFVLFLK